MHFVSSSAVGLLAASDPAAALVVAANVLLTQLERSNVSISKAYTLIEEAQRGRWALVQVRLLVMPLAPCRQGTPIP